MCGGVAAYRPARLIRKARTYQELRDAGRKAWMSRQMLVDDCAELAVLRKDRVQ